MITTQKARELALALPEVEEKDHFGMPSFRLKGKIFMTLQPDINRAMVKLTLEDQSVFSLSGIYRPVPGGWGRQGATFVDLKVVSKRMFLDSLEQAWARVAPKRLRTANPQVGQPT